MISLDAGRKLGNYSGVITMNFFAQHPVLDTVLAYFALAFVGTMPPKGSKWDAETFYDWVYDLAHVMVNYVPASRRPVTDANPQLPAGPANKEK